MSSIGGSLYDVNEDGSNCSSSSSFVSNTTDTGDRSVVLKGLNILESNRRKVTALKSDVSNYEFGLDVPQSILRQMQHGTKNDRKPKLKKSTAQNLLSNLSKFFILFSLFFFCFIVFSL